MYGVAVFWTGGATYAAASSDGIQILQIDPPGASVVTGVPGHVSEPESGSGHQIQAVAKRRHGPVAVSIRVNDAPLLNILHAEITLTSGATGARVAKPDQTLDYFANDPPRPVVKESGERHEVRAGNGVFVARLRAPPDLSDEHSCAFSLRLDGLSGRPAIIDGHGIVPSLPSDERVDSIRAQTNIPQRGDGFAGICAVAYGDVDVTGSYDIGVVFSNSIGDTMHGAGFSGAGAGSRIKQAEKDPGPPRFRGALDISPAKGKVSVEMRALDIYGPDEEGSCGVGSSVPAISPVGRIDIPRYSRYPSPH